MILIDMIKARDIWRDKIREDRKPLLAKLDIEHINATTPEAIKKIIARKQVLRDITQHPSIAAAMTVDELKQINLFEDK